MSKKYALCVGINDYPGTGSDLQGCVNDANDWTRLLTSMGYEVFTMLDEQATKANVVIALQSLVSKAKYLDKIVFTYSGHGSWIPDKDNDEPDGRDEVLVLHDYDRGGLLSDDELSAIFANRRFGVKPIILSDSCHSGSVARFVNFAEPLDRRPRFLNPSHFLAPEELPRALAVENKDVKAPSRPTTALISGCDDPEYSYDAYIDGRPRGAFTAYATKTWAPGITLKAWHQAIRLYLPSNPYPQSPQLGATLTQKRWTL